MSYFARGPLISLKMEKFLLYNLKIKFLRLKRTKINRLSSLPIAVHIIQIRGDGLDYYNVGRQALATYIFSAAPAITASTVVAVALKCSYTVQDVSFCAVKGEAFLKSFLMIPSVLALKCRFKLAGRRDTLRKCEFHCAYRR